MWLRPDLSICAEALGPRDAGPSSPRRRAFDPRALPTWLGFGGERERGHGVEHEQRGPVGTVIRADRDGVVRLRVPLRPGGVGLVLDHGGWLGTVVLHLAQVRAAVGDGVRVGEALGVIGASTREGATWWVAPHVRSVRILGGEPAAFEAPASRDARLDPAAVDDAVAACRDLHLRGVLDALPTHEERAWALGFWRVVAPQVFTRVCSLVV